MGNLAANNQSDSGALLSIKEMILDRNDCLCTAVTYEYMTIIVNHLVRSKQYLVLSLLCERVLNLRNGIDDIEKISAIPI